MALMTKVIDSKPSCYKDETYQQAWRNTMLEEYPFIMLNDVWEIVPIPLDKLVVGSCLVCNIKHKVDGSVNKCKARFVAKGFSQVEGIGYGETFAPVA